MAIYVYQKKQHIFYDYFLGDEEYTDMKPVNTNTPFSLFDDLKKKVEETQDTSYKKAGDYQIIQDISENPYEI